MVISNYFLKLEKDISFKITKIKVLTELRNI